MKEAQADFHRARELITLLGDGEESEVTVRAAMPGVVLETHVALGSAVEPGSPLVDLGKPDATWIVADVFARDLDLVDNGSRVQRELPYAPEPISGCVVGAILRIAPDLRRAAVSMEPDENMKLGPGTYLRVSTEASGTRRIALPPTGVLIQDDRQTYVQVRTGEFQARVGRTHRPEAKPPVRLFASAVARGAGATRWGAGAVQSVVHL